MKCCLFSVEATQKLTQSQGVVMVSHGDGNHFHRGSGTRTVGGEARFVAEMLPSSLIFNYFITPVHVCMPTTAPV